MIYYKPIGIKSRAAATILAESGPDKKHFRASVRGAGKEKRARVMTGSPHIKAALVGAAWSAFTHQRVRVSGALSTTHTQDRDKARHCYFGAHTCAAYLRGA
jgi:transposase